MVSRLKFRSAIVVAVLALVLGETFVESQYYVEADGSSPVFDFNGNNPQQGGDAQPYYPAQGRSVHGRRVVRSVSEEEEEEDDDDDDEEYNVPRRFAPRSGPASSSSSSDEDDEAEIDKPAQPSTRSRLSGKPRPLKLPPGFTERVNKKMKKSKTRDEPLHGDPDPIDEEDEDGRQPEARLLWPFSIEITKGAKEKGWGPGSYGSYGPPKPRFGFPGQYANIGVHKGHYPPGRDGGYFHASSGYGAHNGWGWDAFIEHEKHRLKYEILKLKAKKKIAVLQNKVELKKLFSMLLQKKIQALEWW